MIADTQLNKCIKIAENIHLSYKVFATGIYVSSEGKLILALNTLPHKLSLPQIETDYLEYLCYNTYYNHSGQAYTIADALIADGLLDYTQISAFYSALKYNTSNRNYIIISP